jgi:hypothetical protein
MSAAVHCFAAWYPARRLNTVIPFSDHILKRRDLMMKVSIVSALFLILESAWLFISVKRFLLHDARWISSILHL